MSIVIEPAGLLRKECAPGVFLLSVKKWIGCAYCALCPSWGTRGHSTLIVLLILRLGGDLIDLINIVFPSKLKLYENIS